MLFFKIILFFILFSSNLFLHCMEEQVLIERVSIEKILQENDDDDYGFYCDESDEDLGCELTWAFYSLSVDQSNGTDRDSSGRESTGLSVELDSTSRQQDDHCKVADDRKRKVSNEVLSQDNRYENYESHDSCDSRKNSDEKKRHLHMYNGVKNKKRQYKSEKK